jgi:HEAT repeats
MSIAVLTQVYDEMRRLAIAGSVTAGGDFRLKKLIPSLEQAGAKAPVFAKVAQAVKVLVEGTEQTSAAALLELCTLVNAVLYTQGETGLDGAWADIETTDLGPQTSQVSASVLKPLLEALTTTGSGRLEIIKDSFERGAFRDVRLVKPALDAIDDTYPEIGDFLAKKVLRLYGKALLPDLKSRFDPKGSKGGHLRRLALLHQLDPAGTREIVKQALENGSKEIKVVAIECLGDSPEDLAFLLELSVAKNKDVREAALEALAKQIECLGNSPEDLPFLLEQALAKNKDIRRAALKALAKQDADAAIETFQQALMGDDINIAIQPIQQSRSPKLLKAVIDEAGRQLEALFKTKNTSKEKNEVGNGVNRLLLLLSSLEGRDDTATEEFLVKLFQRHKEILGLKGEPSGAAINDGVAKLMGGGSEKVQKMLTDSHATLSPDILGIAFEAARKSMKPAEVFDAFSPYLLATVDEKKKERDPARAKRAAIIQAITAASMGSYSLDELNKIYEDGTWDPRWLDVAVEIGNEELTCCLARSTHEGCRELLSKVLGEGYEAFANDSSVPFGRIDVLKTMIRIEHPDAIPSLIETIKKSDSDNPGFHLYWVGSLIRGLPKTALAPLEALLPTLREETADQLLKCLTARKNKP